MPVMLTRRADRLHRDGDAAPISQSPRQRLLHRWPRWAHAAAPYCLLCAAILALFWPLVSSTGLYTDERAWNFLRVLEYQRELRSGNVPSTFPTAFGGAGHAFPFFYPPLAYWITAVLSMLVGDVVIGVHASFLASVLLSALAMSALLRRMSCDHWTAAVGALAYVTFPYRLVDVFTRGALAESWAFVWYPFVLFGLVAVLDGDRVARLRHVAAMVAMLLTHTITAVYFAVCALPLGLAWHVQGSWRRWLRLAVTGLSALLVCAFFFVPQISYMPQVWVSDPTTMWTLPELLAARRVPGRTLLLGNPPVSGARLWLGLWGLAFVPAIVLLRLGSGGVPQHAGKCRVMLVCAWLFLLIVAVQLYPPLFFSWSPSIFRYVQFPWRLQGLGGLVAAIGGALCIDQLRVPGWRRGLVLGVSSLLLIAGAKLYDDPTVYVPEWTDGRLRELKGGALWWAGLTAQAEYVPRGLSRDSIRSFAARAPFGMGGAQVLSYRRTAGTMAVIAAGHGTVVLPLFAYPFYQVVDDRGERVSTGASRGLLAVKVSGGPHLLRVERVLPCWQRVGGLVSVVAITLLAVVRARRWKTAVVAHGRALSSERSTGI